MTKVFDKPSGLTLSARRAALLAFLERSVRDAVRSPDVKEFCVGVTARPLIRRREYDRWCDRLGMELRGFAVLDLGRSADHIIESERWLYHRLKGHPKFSDNGQGRYFPSAARHLEEQALYLAWWSW